MKVKCGRKNILIAHRRSVVEEETLSDIGFTVRLRRETIQKREREKKSSSTHMVNRQYRKDSFYGSCSAQKMTDGTFGRRDGQMIRVAIKDGFYSTVFGRVT